MAAPCLLKWSDRLDEARDLLVPLLAEARQRGDEMSITFVLYHCAELECWAGNWEVAAAHAREADEVALLAGHRSHRVAALYARALVDAHLGRVDDLDETAGYGLRLCEEIGNLPVAHQILSVLGFFELSRGNALQAHGHLHRLAQAVVEMGLGEPGVVRFVPDEVEALLGIGELDAACAVLAPFEERARSVDRRWGLAAAARCRALAATARGDVDEGRARAIEAVERARELPMPLELGRALHVQGVVERRARQRIAARDAQVGALAVFERLGAELWGRRAREELERLGGRTDGGLTATEARVAALVAGGLSNREVAERLAISVKTVETHLARVYAKAGVGSRTQLVVWAQSGLPDAPHG